MRFRCCRLLGSSLYITANGSYDLAARSVWRWPSFLAKRQQGQPPELATMEACFVELHALRADQVLQGPSIVKTIVPWNAAADNFVPLEDTESPPLIIGSKHPPNPNEGEQ